MPVTARRREIFKFTCKCTAVYYFNTQKLQEMRWVVISIGTEASASEGTCIEGVSSAWTFAVKSVVPRARVSV